MSVAAKPSAAAEILAYERGVNDALKSFYTRTRYEATTEETPLDALLAAEDGALDEWAVKRETARAILLWIAGDGPNPAALLKRLYLLGDHMMISPYCELTLREKAMMCGDSHGAQHWRMKRICIDPLLRKGARSFKAPGQKGARASAAAAAAQQGNTNRRGSGAPQDNGSAAADCKSHHRKTPKKQRP